MTKIVHMHIPKCGGTSILTLLRQWYSPNRLLKYDRPEDEHYCNYEVLSGHFPYNWDYFDYRWFTFVRHPIRRLESFYFYTTSRGLKSKRNYWWNLIKDMTLEDWLNSEHSKNHMIKFFAGKTPQQELEPHDITRAYESARDFWFIGFQETFAEDVKRLAKKLEVPFKPIPHKLPGSYKPKTDESLYGNNIDFEFYTYLKETWSNTS